MKVLFCSDPLNSKTVDTAYETEFQIAKAMGFQTELVCLEDLMIGETRSAIKSIKQEENETLAFYRGWMLKPEQYMNLYNVLKIKNITLITSPEQYVFCHHLPNSYNAIEFLTAKSLWTNAVYDKNAISELLQQFGEHPIIVKDYVKSRKHEWHEACYIPNANDNAHALKVIDRFIQLQGDELAEGIVLRSYMEFEQIGNHPISGMPLTNERRLFFLNQSLIANLEYWGEIAYEHTDDFTVETFVALAKRIDCPFFTMDVAKTKSGEWMVVEIGDAQVSGLPDRTNVEAFYEQIRKQIAKT